MPALDDYGWTQKNPWLWGTTYAQSTGGADPDTSGEIKGPFTTASGTDFWVRTTDCRVGFNIDNDPDADVWLRRRQVCAADIPQQDKVDISARLVLLNCRPLPCV